MQVAYAPLLKITLQHDYFPDGNSPVVQIIPTYATQRIMSQLGIRLVNRDYGAELFYNNGDNAQGGLSDTIKEQVICLSYILRTNDPLFHNYTVLPEELFLSKVPYYSNLNTGTEFFIENLPLLPAVPANFKITANTPGTPLTIANELENTLYIYPEEEESSDSFKPIFPANEDAKELIINLSGDTPGKYHLREGGDLNTTVLYLPANWQKGDLALVTLYLGDAGEKGVHLLDNDTIVPGEFTATFTTRATKWRYHIIDQQEMHEGFKLLKKETGEVVAELADPPITRDLPNGVKAFILSSPDTIPLRKRPGQLFELSARAKGNNREFTIPLPSADANRISFEEQPTTNAAASAAASDAASNPEPPVFYSDIYVYL